MIEISVRYHEHHCPIHDLAGNITMWCFRQNALTPIRFTAVKIPPFEASGIDFGYIFGVTE